MSIPDEELVRVAKAARTASAGHTGTMGDDRTVMAALINYQAAQLIVEELALLRDKVDSINENIWRSAK